MIRDVVVEVLVGVAGDQGVVVAPDRLGDDSVLLESGLDSLGFAILVAELDARLGYDPFVLMTTPVYPRTLGEFIAVYERFADHARA